MAKRFKSVGFLLALFTASVSGHGSLSIDLTHAIPTFAPSSEDPMKADLSKPHFGSVPIPSFGGQAVLTFGKFPTSDGYFNLGKL